MGDAKPQRLWLSAPNEDGEHEFWFDPDEGGTEYVLASALTALREENGRLRAENGGLKHEALVARLSHEQLNQFIAIFDGVGLKGHHINAQVNMAADEIKSARLRATAAETEAATLRAMLEEAMKALEPFAEAANQYDECEDGDGIHAAFHLFLIGHLRTARAVSAKIKEKSNG